MCHVDHIGAEHGRNPMDSAVESKCGSQLDGEFALFRDDKYIKQFFLISNMHLL